ncbi:MAG: lipocalin-like domain-containing protein [Acidobacteriota bacterium]|nr:lipocalin-like domain-containing protein [Acidobacteriota bacterium]
MRRILLAIAGVSLLFVVACSDEERPVSTIVPAAALTLEAETPFQGAWKLVSIESRTPDGEVTPTENPPLGFIMYDPAGYMGVVIQGLERQPYAGDSATADEALAAVTSYTAYFGSFTVDAEAGIVTHHLVGAMNPGWTGSDFPRHYTFEGDRLTLQPPAGESGNTVHLTWERLPAADLGGEVASFVGFWQLREVVRTDDQGNTVPNENPYDNGYIVYSSSGHMMVHLTRPGRQAYAGSAPTADEATAALRTYGGYVGPFTVHSDEGYVVHHRIGGPNPATAGTDAQRFYTLVEGEQLTLRPPPRTVDGRTIQAALTWARMSDP